jgi:MFS family permease
VAAQLSILQLAFALTWVVYVIYLPALAAQAGIDKAHVPLILAMDQVIFVACDWFAGVYADRVGRAMKRIGGPMAAATLASCVAFIALPFVAPHLGAGVFLALTAFWSATSSALRAPPLALVSRHAPHSEQTWVVGLYLLGLGLASSLAPYAGVALKGIDPRIPFIAASVAVAVFALAIARAERAYAPPAIAGEAEAPKDRPIMGIAGVAFAVLLLAIGFQVHIALNSPPGYLRFVAPEQLVLFSPVFWIGFNLAVLPATVLPRAFGGFTVAACATLVGVAALFGCANATSVEMLVTAQLAVGVAWAIALNGVFSSALDLGRPGREGLLAGVIFSTLAMAALARVFVTYSGVDAVAASAAVPPYAWTLAGVTLIALALRATRVVAAGKPP